MKSFGYNENRTYQSRERVPRRVLPGVPPEIFEEWEGRHKYHGDGEEVNAWSQTKERSSSYDGMTVIPYNLYMAAQRFHFLVLNMAYHILPKALECKTQQQ